MVVSPRPDATEVRGVVDRVHGITEDTRFFLKVRRAGNLCPNNQARLFVLLTAEIVEAGDPPKCWTQGLVLCLARLRPNDTHCGAGTLHQFIAAFCRGRRSTTTCCSPRVVPLWESLYSCSKKLPVEGYVRNQKTSTSLSNTFGRLYKQSL